jgi:hypothetical protein
MRFAFLRPAFAGAAIIASAGILAGGLALRPAFAVGGSAHVGPFVVTHCDSASACQQYGNQGTGIGVEGNDTNKSGNGIGVEGASTGGGSGVFGSAISGPGVNGFSQSGYGVEASSLDTEAVFGTSSGGTAIQGESYATNGNSGVSGISESTTGTGHGVYGRSSNGQGVYGTSSSSNGVEGHSTGSGAAGVAGFALGTSSDSGWGAAGVSSDTTGNYEALLAQAQSATTYIFEGINTHNDDVCFMDPDADFSCTGTFEAKNVRSRHLTRNGQSVLTYASESTSATLEDFGTAQMVDGVANVAIDRAFAATINTNIPYYVFLTPLGDASLYVSLKTAAGFQVRETAGGRSSMSFDYRIVARPLDSANDRLPLAPAMRQIRTIPVTRN